MKFVCRPADSRDMNYIRSSWLKSQRDCGYVGRGCPNEVFFPALGAVVEQLLSRSTVLVLTPEDDDERIAAWAAYEVMPGPELVLHYVYVRRSCRRLGLAKRLVESILAMEEVSRARCTFSSTRADSVRAFRPGGKLWHDPFALFVRVRLPRLVRRGAGREEGGDPPGVGEEEGAEDGA